MTLLYSALFLIICGFFYLNGHKIVYNRYNRLRSLGSAVKKVSHKGLFSILWITFTLVCKALYITLGQKLNKSVRKVNKDTYEVTYVLEGKMYKMLTQPKRGPPKVLQIIERGDDVTDEVLPYLGPSQCGTHSIDITPSILGKSTLYINLETGDEQIVPYDECLQVE